MGRAVGTGSAVVFAGLTVIIAVVALMVIGLPFVTQMGLGAGIAVAWRSWRHHLHPRAARCVLDASRSPRRSRGSNMPRSPRTPTPTVCGSAGPSWPKPIPFIIAGLAIAGRGRHPL